MLMSHNFNAVLVAFLWIFSSVLSAPTVEHEICSIRQPNRAFIWKGERGIITANNLSNVMQNKSFGSRGQRGRSKDWTQLSQQDELLNTTQNKTSLQYECTYELITCSTCVIYIRFRNVTLPAICEQSSDNKTCPCGHIWISEQIPESRTEFCKTPLSPTHTYRSQTRYLTIGFVFSTPYKSPFVIEYLSERNRLYLKGNVSQNVTLGGSLKSPFFPAPYPKDLGAEYVITCQQTTVRCRIKLLFTDFLVSTQSIIEFYDWTGQRVGVSTGSKPRPQVVISTGPSLLVRFFANGASGLGYKANYYFLSGEINEASLTPITDCGGEVENYGGAITMMNMVQAMGTPRKYDCVWLIKPYTNFQGNMQIYTTVISFQNMGVDSEVSVYEGQTSEGLLLETVYSPSTRPRPQHVTNLTTGFYISLKGTFKQSSRLVIAYAVFSQMDCFIGADFLCQNHRCIGKNLYCDGFDHCGDNSDEPDKCSQDWDSEPVDRRWYSHVPNYYFPKVDRYSDLKTATLVFVLSSIGLIFLIAALVLLLYRMGVRARQQRELQNRLQTISNFLEGASIEEVQVSDDPPNYEPPPDYTEIMKKKKEMSQQLRRSMKRKSSRSGRGKPQKTTEEATSTVPDSPPPPYSDNHPSGNLSDGGQPRGEWFTFRRSPPPTSISDPGGSSTQTEPDGSQPQPQPQNSESKFSYDFSKIWSFLPSRGNKDTPGASTCSCEGACGCANSRPRTESVNLPFTAATWSPASSKSKDDDVPGSGKVQNLFNPKSKKPKIHTSSSADNIYYLD